MAKFIEVNTQGGGSLLVNPEKIVYIDTSDHQIWKVFLVDGSFFEFDALAEEFVRTLHYGKIVRYEVG